MKDCTNVEKKDFSVLMGFCSIRSILSPILRRIIKVTTSGNRS
jgi:hypothetical protein